MSEENPSRAELEELRQRWEKEPSPRLSLELAEEYRRAGDLEEAVAVLETAMESHPEHVAARVALGRYRMELGRFDEARSLLEGVVAEDPTHLVANKALVKLHAALGEKKQATDRLALYRLLNESDPEIEELEQRIAGKHPVEQETVADSGLPRERARPAPVLVASGPVEPFPGLAKRLADERYWQAIGAEGIFPVQPALATVARDLETAAPGSVDPARRPVDDEVATVTLANLYLEQGHLDEAESTFQRVLAREPENRQAVEGLERVLNKRAEPAGQTVESRKIAMLKNYLERLRRSSEGN